MASRLYPEPDKGERWFTTGESLFFEYVFQVPANRIGSDYFSLTQLKIVQECVTLIVFTVFAFLIFREPLRWNNLVSYALLIGAVGFAFWPR
jgi:uncharacterized protein (DUF486 family)